KNLPYILEAGIPQRGTNIVIESQRVLRTGTLLQLNRNTRVQRDRRTRIRQPILLRKINYLSELVSTLQLLPITSISNGDEECSAVSETSTPRIPVRIRKHARYPMI